MTSIDLLKAVQQWDRDYEAGLPVSASLEQRRPYSRRAEPLEAIAPWRFQPYQNDKTPNFVEKLSHWLGQFPSTDQHLAFLLATNIVFVTSRQFENLQRRLFRSNIRKLLLESIIQNHGLAPHDYVTASKSFDSEMDRTIFVPNSDSSSLNSFVHLNNEHFANRHKRHLVGPEVEFWTYPTDREAATSDVALKTVSTDFAAKVLATDPRLSGKTRLVVLEDFSGTGSDLGESLEELDRSHLRVSEVVLAPVLATQAAIEHLTARCAKLTKRTYRVVTAQMLPHKLSCFDGKSPSYLDGHEPVPVLSSEVKRLSEVAFAGHFESCADALHPTHKHGFGGLALAVVMASNCPDNTLPMVWKHTSSWKGLFPRASRFL
jgi:hypothetical protein